MSKEDDILSRLKGEELPETHYPEPVPITKTKADKNYKMPGFEDKTSDVKEEKSSPSNKLSEQEKQAAYLKMLKGEPEIEDSDIEITTKPEAEAEPEPEIDPGPEQDSQLPPTLVDDSNDRISAIEDDMKYFKEEIRGLNKNIAKKNEEIDTLTTANSDLFLIDMQTLAEDLNNFRSILLDIGAEKYFEEIEREEKMHGPVMAYKKTLRFYEDARMNSREGLPIITAIEVVINKLNEKLKYTEEA